MPRAGGRVLAILAPFLLVAGPPARALEVAADPAYLDSLVERSRALDLAGTRTWHALLHYGERRLGAGVESRADDPDFFLAPSGKYDPDAELEATLRAFAEPGLRSLGDDASQHTQCAFVARYQWLRDRLGFDAALLPERACPAYDAWLHAMNPGGLTLVFAEAFMNNPASMFGHTLLRVDTRERVPDQDLLAWALNFAGATGDEGGPLYAIKGLAGLYQGFYTIEPYFEKVKTYGDWENRDIWEYRLDLSQPEIERLLAHVWELQGIAFDYYYFDENCSYQLLALLQTVRPELRLTERFPLWVIPADTVRVVLRETDLLVGVAYRPSAETELRTFSGALGPSDRRLAHQVATGDRLVGDEALAALDSERRAAVLSVAYDELRYAFLAGDVGRDESASRARSILVARAATGRSGTSFGPPPRPAVRPDEGHGSARFALETGVRDGEAYVEARIRPALHERLDPEGGYQHGAQIQFFDLALRWIPEKHRLRLEEAVVLDMVSLVPWDQTFHHVSYAFDTGLRTRLIPDADDSLDPEPAWRTRGGVGAGASVGERGLLYALGEATGDVGADLDPEYAVGLGGVVGFLYGGAGRRWASDASVRATGFALGDRTWSLSATWEQRLTLSRNAALVLSAAGRREFHRSWGELGLRWNVYF